MAPAIGERGRRYMRRKIEYSNERIGDPRVVKDFLPSPENLVFKEENVKVTIGLSRKSVDFFKRHAREQHTQYQKMIRHLLDFYVARHQDESLPSASTRTRSKTRIS
jgi:predicted DNA binding CopG/RHH family protein